MDLGELFRRVAAVAVDQPPDRAGVAARAPLHAEIMMRVRPAIGDLYEQRVGARVVASPADIGGMDTAGDGACDSEGNGACSHRRAGAIAVPAVRSPRKPALSTRPLSSGA